jgi:hypothetical protein
MLPDLALDDIENRNLVLEPQTPASPTTTIEKPRAEALCNSLSDGLLVPRVAAGRDLGGDRGPAGDRPGDDRRDDAARVAARRQVPRPGLSPADRTLLAVAGWLLPRSRWSSSAVTPATLLRWHRRLVDRSRDFAKIAARSRRGLSSSRPLRREPSHRAALGARASGSTGEAPRSSRPPGHKRPNTGPRRCGRSRARLRTRRCGRR